MTKKQEREALERYLEHLENIRSCEHVDFNETPAERAKRLKRCKTDYAYFVSYYFPHYAKAACAPFHIRNADRIRRNKFISRLMKWARGLAKSCHADIFIPVWLHLFHDELNCMLLVGKDLAAAKVLLSDLMAEFAGNPQLIADFGELVASGNWAKGNFKTTKGARFFALGKGQSPRGKRNGPNRPDFVVMDDIDDDEECANPKQVDKTVAWVLRALIPAMSVERSRFLMANNLIAPYTVLSNLSENDAFETDQVNALDENGEPSWPYYNKEFYAARRRLMGDPAFQTEYQNNPMKEGKIFRDEHMPYAPPLARNRYNRIVAQWDIAYSESKTADFNAVPIVGLTSSGDKHLIAGFCQQCKMEVALRWMYDYQLALPSTVIVEWYAESQFWNDAVELAMQTVAKEYGWRLPIVFDDRPQGNKFSRMLQMLPGMQRREFYVSDQLKHNPDIQAGLQQVKGIEPGYAGHDDFPDALQTAISKLESGQVMGDEEPIIGARKPSSKNY